jgi:Rod binding domain-containing protein
MMYGVFMLLIVSFFLGRHIHAQEGPVFDTGMLGMMIDQHQKKPKTEEEAIEFVEAYFLEMMFLKPMFQSQPSMLSEEEKAEMGSFADTSMQDQLITRAMAERLAKQDVLGLKKQLKRQGGSSPLGPVEKEAPRYQAGFVMGKVPE